MRAQRDTQDKIESEDAVSVTRAAQFLGVRVGTLYAWIYREKIPAFKLRGRWKVSRTCLESAKRLQHGRSAKTA